MRKETKLYNLIFPIWMLWMWPPVFVVFAVVNLIIDAAVILITAQKLKIKDFFKKYRNNILKAWGFGFLADFIGAGFLLVMSQLLCFLGTTYEQLKYLNVEIRWNIDYNPYGNIFAFLITVVAILISAICIYAFNKNVGFKKMDVAEHEKKILSVVMAIATAPYLFLLPGNLFW